MRLITVLLIAILSSSTPLPLYAEQMEISEGNTQGPGLQDISVEGEPDEHGLIWTLNSPQRAHDPWYAWVYNASDAPLFGIEVSMYLDSGAGWYLPGTRAGNARVWPYQVDPGTIGIVDLGTASKHQRPWTDVKFEVNNIDPEHNGFWAEFTIEDFEGDDEIVSGILVNNTDRPVSQVGVRVACIEDNEVTGIRGYVSDLIALHPDETEPFEFEAGFTCDDDGWIYIPVGSVSGQ